ncbi:MAG: RHS repeat-associated core domain-containing protein, partial [Angustibacter sp.]
YDALGRQNSASFKVVGTGPSVTTESKVTLNYDAANRPVSVADTSASTITQTFDVLDQLTGQSAPGGTVSYSYDRAGRRTGMTVPGQGTTSYSYDDASQLTAITRGTVSTAMTYDQAGRPTSVALPGGVKQNYSFDARSQLTAISYTKGASTLGGLTYSYDAAGQPLAVSGSFARSTLPPVWSGATYDANNRLTKLGTKSLSYDAQGRMLSDGTANYTWNARHQLVASTSPAASYSYDAVDRRASKTVGGVTTGYTYDGANAVQERVGGAVSADLLTGLGADQTLARTSAGTTSALLTDRIGSTIALSDAAGALTTSYTYDPYGRTSATGAANANPSQFAGRENDGTGLYFNRARYYSPSLQRFISADPAGAAGSGANLYEYVGSSPTQFTDP